MKVAYSATAFVEPRLGDLVYYEVDGGRGTITILTVQHPARERPLEDN